MDHRPGAARSPATCSRWARSLARVYRDLFSSASSEAPGAAIAIYRRDTRRRSLGGSPCQVFFADSSRGGTSAIGGSAGQTAVSLAIACLIGELSRRPFSPLIKNVARLSPLRWDFPRPARAGRPWVFPRAAIEYKREDSSRKRPVNGRSIKAHQVPIDDSEARTSQIDKRTNEYRLLVSVFSNRFGPKLSE